MYCRQCHYPLHQLTTHACPECGCTFDPRDPDTFHTERPSALGLGAFGLLVTILNIIAMGAAGFLLLPSAAHIATCNIGPKWCEIYGLFVGGIFLLVYIGLLPLTIAALAIKQQATNHIGRLLVGLPFALGVIFLLLLAASLVIAP